MSEQTPEQAARLRRLLNAVEADEAEQAEKYVEDFVHVGGRIFGATEGVKHKDDVGRRRTGGVFPSRPETAVVCSRTAKPSRYGR